MTLRRWRSWCSHNIRVSAYTKHVESYISISSTRLGQGFRFTTCLFLLSVPLFCHAYVHTCKKAFMLVVSNRFCIIYTYISTFTDPQCLQAVLTVDVMPVLSVTWCKELWTLRSILAAYRKDTIVLATQILFVSAILWDPLCHAAGITTKQWETNWWSWGVV